MTTTALTLAALLSFEAAHAPATNDACERTDDRCKAALYERRAVTTTTADHRAQYLFNAHNLYLREFERTGDARDLCAARRAIEASLAVDGQPERLRAESRALRSKLLARAQQQGARCGSKAKRRATAPDGPGMTDGPDGLDVPDVPEVPVMARGPDMPAGEARPAAAGPTSQQATRPDGAPPPTPLPTGERLPLTEATVAAERPAATRTSVDARPPPVTPAPAPPPGRGLVIAGGLTLAVGAAVTAAAGVMGHRTLQTRREAVALHGTFDGLAPPYQNTRGDALVRDFHVTRSQTLALALAGGATIVVAAVLVTLGGRRMARAARRTALVPGPGGLVLHGRF